MGEAFKWRLISREAFKIGFAALNYHLQIFLPFMGFSSDSSFFKLLPEILLFSLIFREFYIFLLNLSWLLSFFTSSQLNTDFPFNSKSFVSKFFFFPLTLSKLSLLFDPQSFHPSSSIKKDVRKELCIENSIIIRVIISTIKNWTHKARKRRASHPVPKRPRLAQKDLHRPYVYHALLLRSCNLPAHYSTVYQRFRPSTTPPSTCPLSLSISFNLFARGFIRSRDLPLPAPPFLRFDFSLPSIYPRRWSEFIAAEFFLPPPPKGPTCFSI